MGEIEQNRGFSRIERPILIFVLLVATGLFIAGALLPMMTLHKLVFFNQSFSVVAGVVELFKSGKFTLALLIGGFSLGFPAAKLLLLSSVLLSDTPSPFRDRLLGLMHRVGRWSMLDVMVVAVLLVTVKLGAVASVSVHAGLYCFGGAVILMMLLTHRVEKQLAP